MASAPKPHVALLGTGYMGSKMGGRLIDHGFTLHAWNRTADKLKELADKGAHVCSSPKDAVQAADIVILMLADGPVTKDVLLSDAVKAALRGKTVLQMATIGPSESQELCLGVEAAGASYIEAPVLGSQLEAAAGSLQIMIGCAIDPRATNPGAPWSEVLRAMGKEPFYIGPVGSAAATKLACNQLIHTLTIGFSSSLGLVQKSGANVDQFLTIVRNSGFYAPTYDRKLPNMLSRDFTTCNFPTKLMLKDVNLYLEEARKAGLDTRPQQAYAGVVASALEQGLGEMDYSSVYEAVVHPQQQQQAGQQGQQQGQQQQ